MTLKGIEFNDIGLVYGECEKDFPSEIVMDSVRVTNVSQTQRTVRLTAELLRIRDSLFEDTSGFVVERTNVLLDNCTFVNPTKSIGHVVGELELDLEPSSLLLIRSPPKVTINKCNFSHLINIGKETFYINESQL